MSYKLPPVPLQDITDLPYTLQEWFRKIQQLVSSAIGAIPWATVDKTGSNLTDFPTRNHNDLQNKQGGTTSEYYHLTSAEHSAIPTFVVGPASAVDGNVVLFNTTTGKLVKDGGTLGTGAFSSTYVLPIATASVLGGVKPDGTSVLNTAGVLSVSPASVGSPSGSGTSSGSNTGDNVEVAAQAIGFTITKGTTPKTLTVALDANVSGTNTGDQTNISGNAATVTNGVYTTGAGTVFLAPSGSAANLTSFPTLNQDTTGKSAKTDALNSATTVVNVAAATAPTVGQVLTATDSTHATWQAAATSSVPPGLTAFLAAHG